MQKYLVRLSNGRYIVYRAKVSLRLNDSVNVDTDDFVLNGIVVQIGIGEFMPVEERFIVKEGQFRGIISDEFNEPHMK